ncbi:MAG TPA: DinB family protein [Actinomycetota bacterium]|nr:DinB family protein [Actinomycetota bacterium]
MDGVERAQLIERYGVGYAEVESALAGMTGAELDARPGPDEWSAREIVHHLADSEMTSAIRLRKLLAEDNPTIQGYNEPEFARRLHYDRPFEGSLVAFKGARESTASLLATLSDGDWARSGTHTESGAYSVETWLQIYAAHGHDHADQIRRARASATSR